MQWYLNNGVDNVCSVFPKKKRVNESNIIVSPEKDDKKYSLGAEKEASMHLDKVSSTDQLRQAIINFCDCALKKTAKNIVFSDGNPKAKLMLIGEAPGEEEDKLGKPFIGQAGQLLDKMLNSIGLDRSTVYLSNIIFWRPPGNRKPTKEEILSCLPFVKKHIELINPELLILAGATAAKSIYNQEEGITQIRGKWKTIEIGNLKELKSIAIFHPSFLLRQPSRKREAWEDLKKIKVEIYNNT